MANLVGSIVNGQYQKTDLSNEATGVNKTEDSSSLTQASSGTKYDQEMFLQLLVAEMQYQDPLEPTSNTEYVSELASFTQIEAIQAVQGQMETIQANSLVGKYVIMLEDGEYVSGKVDYVEKKGDTLYLSINDQLYDIANLDSVVDESYYNAVMQSEAFTDAVMRLPDVNAISLSDEKAVAAARAVFDAMDSYTKGFVKQEVYDKLVALEKRIESLKPKVEEREPIVPPADVETAEEENTNSSDDAANEVDSSTSSTDSNNQEEVGSDE